MEMIQSIMWPENPKIYEINTWVWLEELSNTYNRKITLENVPDEIFEENLKYFDVIWLMGIWTRSRIGIEVARHHTGLKLEFYKTLNDFCEDDIVGSPYSIKSYTVDSHFGGERGLHAFREKLNRRNKLLILDYVPNHVALDNPWSVDFPQLFITGNKNQFKKSPEAFHKIGRHIYAHGKDPYFDPWTDTIQLNAFSQDYRDATIDTLLDIGRLCDGVRCDMAMLMTTQVFKKTWKDFIDLQELPTISNKKEYWVEVINSVKKNNPDFKFIAEVYWDMEYELIKQGFDFCYDKTLYDHLLHHTAHEISIHLANTSDYQQNLLRFIENHDEQRSYRAFGWQKSLAALTIAMFLPGARLIHLGQEYGRYLRLPVQLNRFPDEPLVPMINDYYQKFFPIWQEISANNGVFHLIKTHLYDGNQHENPFISYRWEFKDLIFYAVINYSLNRAKGRISFDELALESYNESEFEFSILLSDQSIALSMDQLKENGFYIELAAWGIQLFKFQK